MQGRGTPIFTISGDCFSLPPPGVVPPLLGSVGVLGVGGGAYTCPPCFVGITILLLGFLQTFYFIEDLFILLGFTEREKNLVSADSLFTSQIGQTATRSLF